MAVRGNISTGTNTGISVGTRVTPSTRTSTGQEVSVGSVAPGTQVSIANRQATVEGGGGGNEVPTYGYEDVPYGWGNGGEGGFAGYDGGQQAAADAIAARAEAALAARNTQQRKDNDARIAMDAVKKQAERREEKPVERKPVPSARAAKPTSRQQVEEETSERPNESPRRKPGDTWTTYNPVSRTEYTHEILPDMDYSDEYDEYYSFGSEGRRPSDRERAYLPDYMGSTRKKLVDESNDLEDARDEYMKQAGPIWATPEGLRMTADEHAERREREAIRERAMQDAPDVGDMQEDLLARSRAARKLVEGSRYHTPADIRSMVEGTYTSTPSGSGRSFTFEGDDALEFRRYESDATDEQILRNVRELASKDGPEVDTSQRSESTSIDAQKTGYVDYDPDSTVSDNVRNARRAAASTAQIIANPMMIKIEGDYVERRQNPEDPRYTEARVRSLNQEGKDIEGAIGHVRRKFGCSNMDARRLVFLRLGLGVDSKGLICGKKVEDFELPATIFIEAARDVVKSQEEFGVPNAIVDGRPGGYGGYSRDYTGMFPMLGGTRCYPMGYVPKFLFEGISGDPGSPLHGMSWEEFQRGCMLTWLNDTQPRILANTDGPLAWQAAAINMAMEGIMGIDGIPGKVLNIPEYHVNRTKAQMEADLADAGDVSMQQAFDERLRVMPKVMSRWANMNFKDGGTRSNGTDDLQPGEVINPGKDPRRGPVARVLQDLTGIEAVASVLRIGLILTGPIEGAVATAQQQVAVSTLNAYKRHLEGKWNMGGRFDKSDYLREVASSDGFHEALDVYLTLMRIGGRTAVDAFRYDMEDKQGRQRYHATKKDMRDFLKRWGADQGSDVKQRIDRIASFVMIGDGMFKRTHSQQFMDMALYEMAQNQLRGGQAFDASQLEEIARSGELRSGAGEALVSALLDTDAGYEAFKTMGITSLSRTTPMGRATRVVLQHNGVIDATVRNVINMFPEYHVNRLSRMMPLTNTVSYVLSHLVKSGALKAGEDLQLSGKFAKGFNEVTQALSRVSDYQVGMDSADFWVGLWKNVLYDAVMFTGNYIVMGGIIRAVIAMLGGLVPPDDEKKITLPEEWVIKGLGVPIKAAWFMDDLVGCGLPLAYAWAISDGWDEYDADGNVVGHVDAWSDRATGVASSAFVNMVCGFNRSNFVVDAIDFVTNFRQNVDDIANWTTNSVEEMRRYYGDDAINVSDAQLRQEWLWSRIEGIGWDLFGRFTPQIINEVLPGTRDSMWRDDYTHSTSKMYDIEKYDLETAKAQDRTRRLSYRDAQRCRKTQDNVIGAFLSDLLDARDGIEYQYSNMPIDTTADPRTLAGLSFEARFSLPDELLNGNPNLDMTGPDGKPDGKADTAEEREQFLFDRAEDVCKYIRDEYILAGGYPELAIADGFVLPYDARKNAENYCYYMIGTKSRTGKLWQDFYDRKAEEGYLPQEEYDAVKAEVQMYTDILYNYLRNDDIPWRTPRYAHLSTDTNVMYVDSEGNATNALDPDAHEVTYDYGNRPSTILPFTSPRDTGLNDYNSMLWDVLLDDEGNPINDMSRVYDEAEAVGDVAMGRWEGNNVLQMFTNEGKLGRGDMLNLGRRAWEVMDGTLPDVLDDPEFLERIGAKSYLPGEESETDGDNGKQGTPTSVGGAGGGYGGGSYYPRYYSSGGYSRSYSGGGGGYSSSYSSSYNPKIYSTSRQVNGDRASGLSTRSPYKATTTYLRPDFYTKGSREAYKRSDI